MTVEVIGFISLAVGFIGMFFSPWFIVTAFLLATLLGSAAAFILESVGYLNISPAHFLLGFVAVKLLIDKAILQRTISAILPGRPGFWLLLAVVYGLASAYFMPRLFAGQTRVFPVRIYLNTETLPLEPTMSNLTQSFYLIADFMTFALIYGYGGSLSGYKVLGNAALACVVLNLLFAVLDLLTYSTGTTELLAFIRNARYTMIAEAEMFGFKRIVGSFIEASMFASTTVGYFAFTFRLWLLGFRPMLTSSLSFLSLTALIFATSTTGYVGLALFMLFVYIQTSVRAALRPVTPQMLGFMVGGPPVLLLVVILVALNDESSRNVQGLLDSLILGKMSTASGLERLAWNQQAIENFFDTFGFGVGLGSLRASSFPIVVLASFGIVGTPIFGLFFVNLLFSGPTKQPGLSMEEATRQAAKSTCIAWLITDGVAGALSDLGVSFFAFAALACVQPSLVGKPIAVPDSQRQRRPMSLAGAELAGVSKDLGSSIS
jgi:hypothetical protein